MTDPSEPDETPMGVGFDGYTGCPSTPCTGTRASTCMAAGDCAALALLAYTGLARKPDPSELPPVPPGEHVLIEDRVGDRAVLVKWESVDRSFLCVEIGVKHYSVIATDAQARALWAALGPAPVEQEDSEPDPAAIAASLNADDRALLLAIVDRGDETHELPMNIGARPSVMRSLVAKGLAVYDHAWWRPTPLGIRVAETPEPAVPEATLAELFVGRRLELLLAIVERGDAHRGLPADVVHAMAEVAWLESAGLVHWSDDGCRFRPTERLAGLIRPSETPEQVARREMGEQVTYVDPDPDVHVGVLGRDCPEGWEWSSDGRQWWESDGSGLANNTIGMIRPERKPSVTIEVPADLAESFAGTAWSEKGITYRLAELIRGVREAQR